MFDKIWKKEFFKKFSRFLIRHAVSLLVLAVLLSALSIYAGRTIRIDSDYMAFLPENFPGVQNLRKVIKKTGGFGNFMIVLEGGDRESRRRYAQKLAIDVQKFDWVDYAEYKKGWEKIEKNKFLYLQMDDLKTILKRIQLAIGFRKNPLLVSLFGAEDAGSGEIDFSDIEKKYQTTSFGSDYFEDSNELANIVVVWAKGSMTEINFAVNAHQDLGRLLASHPPGEFHPALKASVGGEFRNKIDEYEALKGDVAASTLLSFAGIALLIYLFYRHKRAVFCILVPLFLAVLWSFGLAAVTVGRLNLTTVFLIAILFGLGVEYGIYLYSRYAEERAKGVSLEETIAVVLFETGRAAIGSAVTMAMAFATLIFMDFKGFQEFGIIAGTGMLVIFFTFFIYGPVSWILGERWGFFAAEKIRKPFSSIKRLPLSHGMVWGGLALAALGLVAIPFLSFEYDYGKLRSRKNTYWKLDSIIHEIFPLSKTPAVVIADTMEEARLVVGEVNRRIPDTHTINAVRSIVDFLPEQIDEKKAILDKIRRLLLDNEQYMDEDEKETARRYLPYLTPDTIRMEDLPKGVLRYFTGLPGTPGHLVFIYDKVRLSDARMAMEYHNDIREIRTPHKTYYPAEGSLLFADALQLMKKQANIAFWFMLVTAYLYLCWDLRSVKNAAVVFLPLCLSLLATLGIMFAVGIKLNIFNLVIFPLLIGIGIDGYIHLHHRFHEEGHDDAGIARMIESTVNPLLLATFTSMLGFGSMIMADHRGLQSSGMVALIGMSCQLAVALFFFPAFLKWRVREELHGFGQQKK